MLKLGRARADPERDADLNGPALKPEVEVGHKLCLAVETWQHMMHLDNLASSVKDDEQVSSYTHHLRPVRRIDIKRSIGVYPDRFRTWVTTTRYTPHRSRQAPNFKTSTHQ